MIQAPLQVRADRTAWSMDEFKFTKGIQNALGRPVNMRVGSVRGIQRGGFGHTNPAWPTLHDEKLYWVNGTGVLYVIDTTKPEVPNRFTGSPFLPSGIPGRLAPLPLTMKLSTFARNENSFGLTTRCELGHCELGHCELGHCELGHCELGHWELGHWELGHWELGHWELGHWKLVAGNLVCAFRVLRSPLCSS